MSNKFQEIQNKNLEELSNIFTKQINQDLNEQSNYQNYQLQWMIDHNYSLNDLIDSLNDYINENPEEYITTIENKPYINLHNVFNDWEYNSGFNQKLYVCEDEFYQNQE